MGDDPETGEIVEGGIGAQTVCTCLYRRRFSHGLLRLAISAAALWLSMDLQIVLQAQAIANIKACLEAAGSSLDKVISRRLFMTDRSEFRTVDALWGEAVGEPYPVSTLIGCSWLAKDGARVEIEVVAEV